jgi:bZIP transcription factor
LAAIYKILRPARADETEEETDERRSRRVMANRQSAQRSRLRKLHYISELERDVTSVQGDLRSLSPQVESLRSKHAGARDC